MSSQLLGMAPYAAGAVESAGERADGAFVDWPAMRNGGYFNGDFGKGGRSAAMPEFLKLRKIRQEFLVYGAVYLNGQFFAHRFHQKHHQEGIAVILLRLQVGGDLDP